MLILRPQEYGLFSTIYLFFAYGVSLQYSLVCETWTRHRATEEGDDSGAYGAALLGLTVAVGAVALAVAVVLPGLGGVAAILALAVTLSLYRTGARYFAAAQGRVRKAVLSDVAALVAGVALLLLFPTHDVLFQLSVSWCGSAAAGALAVRMPFGSGPFGLVPWTRTHGAEMRALFADSALMDIGAIGTPFVLAGILPPQAFGIYRAVGNAALPSRILLDPLRPQMGRRPARWFLTGRVVGLLMGATTLLAVGCYAALEWVIKLVPVHLGTLAELQPFAIPTAMFAAASFLGQVFYVAVRTNAPHRTIMLGRVVQTVLVVTMPLLGALLFGLSGGIWGFVLSAALSSAYWMALCGGTARRRHRASDAGPNVQKTTRPLEATLQVRARDFELSPTSHHGYVQERKPRMERTVNKAGPIDEGASVGAYFRVLRRHWIGSIVMTVLCTLAGLAWFITEPPTYQADASGMFVPAGADNLTLSYAGDSLSKSKATNYESVAMSQLLAERVQREGGFQDGTNNLLAAISVSVPTSSSEIKVSATSKDPVRAQRLANAWMTALSEQVQDIEKSVTLQGEPSVRLIPLGQAQLPAVPTSPNLRLDLGAGVVSGLLLSLTYAVIRSRADRRIRTPDDVEGQLDLPVVGTIPFDRSLGAGPAVLGPIDGHYAIAEAMRELRTNLRYIDVDNRPRLILVTSPLPSEGKSVVVGNLAAAIAENGDRVVVVDADLRRPNVHNVFGVRGYIGLTEVLSGRASVSEVLQEWADNPLVQIMPAGHIPPNPSELLGSKAMKSLLEGLAQDAIVLLDSPPLVPVTDAAVLARIVDGTMIVARAGVTRSDQLTRAVRNLERVQGHLLGIIVNAVARVRGDKQGYNYYGPYGSSEMPRRSKAKGSRRGRPTDQPRYKADASPSTEELDDFAPVAVASGQLFDSAQEMWLPASIRNVSGRRGHDD